MLPRCNAAILFILVLVLGIAIADRHSGSIRGEAGLASPPEAAALGSAQMILSPRVLASPQVLVSAQADDHEVRQSSPPAVAHTRSASGEQEKSFFAEQQSDWRCLTQARFVLSARYVADIPQFRTTTRFSTGPPANAA